ncbi:unnamed protein product [Triticum turgidum subsp. durum]|uniref:Uncharacterized protein n=1 Tax=Triticum turgidum subsp. durum TaxID=4567 RepID=A0A9R1QK45_TRITD|nr:unnamed protein product [Triticum turgidum subsp. durum]
MWLSPTHAAQACLPPLASPSLVTSALCSGCFRSSIGEADMVAARPDGGEIRWSKLGMSLLLANIQALVASSGELTADQIERNLLSPESIKEEVAKLRFACAEWGFFQPVQEMSELFKKEAGSSNGEGWGNKRQQWRGAGLDQAPGRLAPGQTCVALPTKAARERSGGRGHEEAAWDLSSSMHSWSRRSTPRSTHSSRRMTSSGSRREALAMRGGDLGRRGTRGGDRGWRGTRRWSWSEGKAPARFLSGGGAVPGRRTSSPAQVKNPMTASLAMRIIAQVQAGGSDVIRGVGGGRRQNQRRKWARADGRRRNQPGGACPGDARGRRRKKMGPGSI